MVITYYHILIYQNLNFLIYNFQQVKFNMNRTVTTQLQQLSKKNIYFENIKMHIEHHNAGHHKIQYQSKPIIIEPTLNNIKINQQCRSRLSLEINKSRKSKNAILMGYERFDSVERLQYLNNFEEDDIRSIQETQENFCIGLIISRQQNYDILKRLQYQLRTCMKGWRHNLCEKNENSSKLDPIMKQFYKNVRLFLIIQKQQQYFTVNMVCYYPNIKFKLKQIKINSMKLVTNQVYTRLHNSYYEINTFGYLTQDSKGRLILIQKADPNIQTLQSPALTGVWLFSDFKFNEGNIMAFISQNSHLVWTPIVQYLRNQQIKRVSTLAKNTGLLCILNKSSSSKISSFLFLFELIKNEQNKWTLLVKKQNMKEIPKIINYKQLFKQQFQYKQELIKLTSNNSSNKNELKTKKVDSQRIQREIISQNLNYQIRPVEKSRNRQFDQVSKSQDMISMRQISECRSQKSYDDKDMQIILLKQQVQFQKQQIQSLTKKCKELEEQNRDINCKQVQFMQFFKYMNGYNYMQNFMKPFPIPTHQIPQKYTVSPNKLAQYYPTIASPNTKVKTQNYAQSEKCYEEERYWEQESYEKSCIDNLEEQTINYNKMFCFPQQKQEQLTFSRKTQQNYEQLPNTQQKVQSNTKIFLKKNYSFKEEKQNFSTKDQIPLNKNLSEDLVNHDYKNISFGEDNQFDTSIRQEKKSKRSSKNNQQFDPKSPQFKIHSNEDMLEYQQKDQNSLPYQSYQKNAQNKYLSSDEEKDNHSNTKYQSLKQNNDKINKKVQYKKISKDSDSDEQDDLLNKYRRLGKV